MAHCHIVRGVRAWVQEEKPAVPQHERFFPNSSRSWEPFRSGCAPWARIQNAPVFLIVVVLRGSVKSTRGAGQSVWGFRNQEEEGGWPVASGHCFQVEGVFSTRVAPFRGIRDRALYLFSLLLPWSPKSTLGEWRIRVRRSLSLMAVSCPSCAYGA